MEVRDRIIREAAELFLLNGVKKVKMDNIAKKIKVSKRTIYENFENKDSLIRATIDLAQKEQIELNNMIVSESENIIEAVLALLKNGSEMLVRINPDYFSDLKRLYSGIWKEKIEQSKVHSFKLILELLKKGKEQGIYRDDINEEIIALILIEQLSMLSEQKFPGYRKFSLVEFYENIIINMTRGVATEKGLRLLEKYRQTPSPTHPSAYRPG
jgi:TetR/AcrR family transcriptional regulator, cholesterol catabolism regulator